MAKHTGEADRDLDNAIHNAAKKALDHPNGGPGKYVVDEIQVNVVRDAAAAPGSNPIRDYIVTVSRP
jgi:hypothetical protein